MKKIILIVLTVIAPFGITKAAWSHTYSFPYQYISADYSPPPSTDEWTNPGNYQVTKTVHLFVDAYVATPSQVTLKSWARISFDDGVGGSISVLAQTSTSDGTDWDNNSPGTSKTFKHVDTRIEYYADFVGVRGSFASGWADIHW